MKNPVTRGLAAIAIPSLFLIGCYTQVAVQEEPRYGYSYPDQDRSAYTDTTNTGDDYDGARRRFYYEYYPTVAVGFGVGSWYYNPWYYDPWYYGAWPGPYYYGGWYGAGYYPGYYPGYCTPYHYGVYYGTTRTFGNTRTIGTGRGAVGTTRVGGGYNSNMYRSGGARSGGSGTGTGYRTQAKPLTGQSSSSQRISAGRRGSDGARIAAPSSRQRLQSASPGRLSSGRDRERSRDNGYRMTAPSPRNEGSGSGRTYSPAPSRPSAPPSSGGGSRSSGGGGGGGSRGGSRR
jgi:hypothetical protein